MDFENLKILLVGNDSLKIEELNNALQIIGFHKSRILMAKDQKEAIIFAELNSYKEPFDLIIFNFTDAKFAKIIELKNIKKDRYLTDIPVLVILNKGDDEFFRNSEEFKKSGLMFKSLISSLSNSEEIKKIIYEALK